MYNRFLYEERCLLIYRLYATGWKEKSNVKIFLLFARIDAVQLLNHININVIFEYIKLVFSLNIALIY